MVFRIFTWKRLERSTSSPNELLLRLKELKLVEIVKKSLQVAHTIVVGPISLRNTRTICWPDVPLRLHFVNGRRVENSGAVVMYSYISGCGCYSRRDRG